MQIELLKRKYISVLGTLREFPAGSTVDVGRLAAMEWIEAGDAVSVHKEPKRVAKKSTKKPVKKPSPKAQPAPAATSSGARVRLLTIKHISVRGTLKTFQSGDWVKVGRQTARAWIASGEADYPGLDKVDAIVGKCKNCGILVRGDKKRAAHIKRVKVVGGKLPALPFGRTLLWNPELKLTPAQAVVGFSRTESTGDGYDAWEVAAMLLSDRALAVHHGSDKEKRKTKAVIGDLRIPVYDTRAVWMRKTETTQMLVAAWAAEIEAGANEAHAFLRALYSHPVLVCTLPAGWVGIR